MTNQPSGEQRAMAPQYSPDGRWWWNGQEWQPGPLHARLVPPSTGRIRPGRWLYIMAGVFVATGALVLVVDLVNIRSPFSTIANATRISAPGTSEIALGEAGTYTISYEQKTVGNVGGSVESNGPTPNIPPQVATMQLDLVSTASGRSVHIHEPSGTYTYSAGNTEGVAIGVFSVDRPGTYSLTSRYADGSQRPQIVLAIVQGTSGAVLGQGLLIILSAFAAFAVTFVGIVVGAVTLYFRMRAKDRVRAAESRRPGL